MESLHCQLGWRLAPWRIGNRVGMICHIHVASKYYSYKARTMALGWLPIFGFSGGPPRSLQSRRTDQKTAVCRCYLLTHSQTNRQCCVAAHRCIAMSSVARDRHGLIAVPKPIKGPWPAGNVDKISLPQLSSQVSTNLTRTSLLLHICIAPANASEDLELLETLGGFLLKEVNPSCDQDDRKVTAPWRRRGNRWASVYKDMTDKCGCLGRR
jgi:hypothetical protein